MLASGQRGSGKFRIKTLAYSTCCWCCYRSCACSLTQRFYIYDYVPTNSCLSKDGDDNFFENINEIRINTWQGDIFGTSRDKYIQPDSNAKSLVYPQVSQLVCDLWPPGKVAGKNSVNHVHKNERSTGHRYIQFVKEFIYWNFIFKGLLLKLIWKDWLDG